MAVILDTIILPSDLRIPELNESKGIFSETQYSIGGTQIIFESEKYGRYLTLTGGDGSWISYSDLQSLIALSDVPNAQYTLTFGSTTYNVRFRNDDHPSVSALPVLEYHNENYDSNDMFNELVVKLVEV